MRSFKIVLSILFVLAIGFFVARSCVPKRPAGRPAREKVSVVLRPKTSGAAILGRKAVEGARLAIILDDWGNNYRLLQFAADIHEPLTLSVLPHLPFSQKIAQEAKSLGLGVMLHMPMQPKSTKAPLEPRTILTTMQDSEIRDCLKDALESVPGVEGVNNHEGSAATSDLRVMRIVLGELKQRGLFFVDSNVISTTVCPRVAKETGIRFTRREVFIDNEMKVESIKRQLERAKAIALRHGKVVVIGHDKELTLQTIKELAPEFEKEGIRFVLVRDLVS